MNVNLIDRQALFTPGLRVEDAQAMAREDIAQAVGRRDLMATPGPLIGQMIADAYIAANRATMQAEARLVRNAEVSCPEPLPTPRFPYQCPVCLGACHVASGFYTRVGTSTWPTSSTSPEPCRSCAGTGVVWG